MRVNSDHQLPSPPVPRATAAENEGGQKIETGGRRDGGGGKQGAVVSLGIVLVWVC